MTRTISSFQFPASQRGFFNLGLPVDGEIVHVQKMSEAVIGVFASHQNLGAPLRNRPMWVIKDGEVIPNERYRGYLGTWFDGKDGWMHVLDVTPADTTPGPVDPTPPPAAVEPTKPAAAPKIEVERPRNPSTVGVSTARSVLGGEGTTPKE